MKCSKCGSADVHMSWHASRLDCTYEQRRRNDWKLNADHLHRFCRSCGYTWANFAADSALQPPQEGVA